MGNVVSEHGRKYGGTSVQSGDNEVVRFNQEYFYGYTASKGSLFMDQRPFPGFKWFNFHG